MKMKQVCTAFEKANPLVKVELTIDKKLEAIITPGMKSGDYPDVLFRSVGAESALTETFDKALKYGEGVWDTPAVKDGGERASYTFFEQIWMPKGAVNQEIGKEFIAYLYSDEAADIFAANRNNSLS